MMTAACSLQAAVLSGIPMQGGMLMPMVAYHAEVGRMQVMVPAAIPQLTPLLVSNPGDGFDATDPWFAALDPSRQGASFSRRYGFMMDAMSDPLPGGTAMWIRKLSGPAELAFHRYSSSAPKAFEPIFGTDGATNAFPWDGLMFHPVTSMVPSTNSCAAIFEVYLVNSTTGQEVPNSGSGPVVLNWTNIPDGRPALNLARTNALTVVLGWPSGTVTNWVLQSASAVNASAWTTVTNLPVMVNNQPHVLLDANAPQQYFRMGYVP